MVLTLIASGDVSDYLDTSSLQQSIASIAGVEASLVTIRVASASVVITATIAVPASSSATSFQASLSNSLSTVPAASTLLGIPVEGVPTVEVSATSTPSSDGIGNGGIIIGGVVSLPSSDGIGSGIIIGGVVGLVLMGAGVFSYMKYGKRCVQWGVKQQEQKPAARDVRL